MKSRHVVWLVAVAVLLASAEMASAQFFQRSMMQPTRGRLGAAPVTVPLAVACLDFGVPNARTEDTYASVTPGHAFLIRSDAGREMKVDLNELLGKKWVVLRGTGKDDELVAEIRVPGWDEIQILPGAQALPPGAEEVPVPKDMLDLVDRTATLEAGMEGLRDKGWEGQEDTHPPQ